MLIEGLDKRCAVRTLVSQHCFILNKRGTKEKETQEATYMELASQFAVASHLHIYPFVQREADEIQRLFNGGVHSNRCECNGRD